MTAVKKAPAVAAGSSRQPVAPGPDHRLALPACSAWVACAVGWLRPAWWQAVAAACLLVALAALASLARRPRGRHALVGPKAGAAILLGAGAALLAGVHTHLLFQAEADHPLVGGSVEGRVFTLEGSVCAWPAPTKFGWRVEVCLDRLQGAPTSPEGWGGPEGSGTVLSERRRAPGSWEEMSGRVEVRAADLAWSELSLGQRIRFSGTTKPVARHERALVRVKARRPPTVLDSPAAVEWRQCASARVRSKATSPLVAGLGWGQRTDLPAQMTAQMRATSLTHLTAVSGAHLAIVVGLVAALAGGPRWLRLSMTGLCAAGFVWLVGPSASVVRSATMVAIVIAGLALNRAVTTAGALWLTATTMLLLDPHNALDYSFVLSFLATAGIVILSPRIASPLSRHIPRWLAVAVAVPVAAQVATFPVTVLLTPALPVYSVPANLLAGLAVGPATVAALLALAAGEAWWGAPALWLADVLSAWIAGVAAFFAGLPGASLPWASGPGGAALAGVLLALVAAGVAAARSRRGRACRRRIGRAWRTRFAGRWRRRGREGGGPRWGGSGRGGSGRGGFGRGGFGRGGAGHKRRAERESKRAGGRNVAHPARTGGGQTRSARAGRSRIGELAWWGVPLLVLFVGSAALWWWARGPGLGGQWEVYQCDVGQGSAALVRTDAGGAVLLDTGPAEGQVDRCIAQAGVTRIDLLVISHLHADHIDGLPAVLKQVPVGQALLGPGVVPSGTHARVIAQLEAAGVPHRVPQAGERGELPGGVRWRVLGPSAGLAQASRLTEEGMNNASLVLGVERGGLDVLVPGDAEQASQSELTAASRALPPADGTWDVTLVPHHGSANWDPALPAAVGAPVALISVGADNTYGHPAPRVEDAYRQWGRVYRTDLCGPIALAARRGAEGNVAGLRVEARCRGG